MDDAWFLQEAVNFERQQVRDLERQLRRIAAEVKAELARIERDGGEAGFALRILAMAGGSDEEN